MRSRANTEVYIGCGQLKAVEESSRHLVVIMLAGMHQDLLVLCAQLPAHRRDFDELRPRPNDSDDLHRASANFSVSSIAVEELSPVPDSDMTAGRPMLM